MACAFVNGIIPTFKLGHHHTLIIFGDGFVEGELPIRVDLKNTEGRYEWHVDHDKTTLLSGTQIQILAKLIKVVPDDPGGGVGDLTITVTNGNATPTPPTSVQVNYDDTPAHIP